MIDCVWKEIFSKHVPNTVIERNLLSLKAPSKKLPNYQFIKITWVQYLGLCTVYTNFIVNNWFLYSMELVNNDFFNDFIFAICSAHLYISFLYKFVTQLNEGYTPCFSSFAVSFIIQWKLAWLLCMLQFKFLGFTQKIPA